MEYEVQIHGAATIGELVVTDEGVVVELIGTPDDQNVAWAQETDLEPEEVSQETPYAIRLIEF